MVKDKVNMDSFDDYTLYLNEMSEDLLNVLNALSVKDFSEK
jgi:hypothetical protein